MEMALLVGALFAGCGLVALFTWLLTGRDA
jgi:hypothetical protein